MDTTDEKPNNGEEGSFLTSLIKRLESATSKIESIILSNPSYSPRPAASSHDHESNSYLTQFMGDYLKKCNEIHPIVESQALLLKEGILETLQSKPPNEQKVSEYISKIQSSKDRREFDPILKVVAELSPVLGWPWASFPDMFTTLFKGAKEASEFYRNKLYTCVKNEQIPGFFCLLILVRVKYESIESWATSLFELIDAVKKVAFDRMNGTAAVGSCPPCERSTSTGKALQQTAQLSSQKPSKENPKQKGCDGPSPLIELRGDSKWIIEGQIGSNISLPQKVESKHSIYVFKCKDAVLSLESSKFTTASIDQCEGFGFVVGRVISGIEIVRSKGLQIQVLGFCPTISIDSSESIQIYLSKECIGENTQVITSNSSSVNILFQSPAENEEDAEWIEKPVPEQFVSVVNKDGLYIATTPQGHI